MTKEPAKATRAALGQTLVELFEEGVDVYAVDADLSGSTTTARLREVDPSRHINVGIAEQNMIGVAAGLALTGKTVFTGSFAVFGTGRVYDQIRNSVCYAGLDVKLAPTHAGISVGPDGGSHQMIEDLALMRVLPGMRVLVPADYHAARAALRIAALTPGPFYVRLGRASVPQIYESPAGFALGSARVLRPGRDVTIVACGMEVPIALEAAMTLAERGIEAELIDAFSLKPLDEATILASASKTGAVLVAEEHSIIGGLGSAVAEALCTRPGILTRPLMRVGVQDRFGSSGGIDELFREYRLDAQAICELVLQ
ncbi:MAG: transketolase family protein [Coriobacteriales bacterium]|jgi:transketolase|nr:transketolase family protein [Coriobacteriales bacterium]